MFVFSSLSGLYWKALDGRRRCRLSHSPANHRFQEDGEMSEWLKEHAWKACVGETLPWVRIPLSPPINFCDFPERFGKFLEKTVSRTHGRSGRGRIIRETDECRPAPWVGWHFWLSFGGSKVRPLSASSDQR